MSKKVELKGVELKEQVSARAGAPRDHVNRLRKRVENLEQCLAKVCHYTGTEKVLDEFGIGRYEVKRVDMTKWG